MLLHHVLEASAERHPEKIALVFGEERLSYAELDARADDAAQQLRDFGVRAGDRVATWLENSVEAVVAIFAALKAGAAFVPLNPQTRPPKVAFILRDCGARVLVAPHANVTPEIQCAVLDLAPRHPEPRRRRRISEGEILRFAQDDGGAAPEMLDLAPRHPEPRRRRRISEGDGGNHLAAIIYTSGSTGVPRGVMLTHGNMLAASSSIIEYLENTEDDVVLDFLPLSFDYGLYNVLMPIRFGGTVVLERTFIAPHQIVSLMRRERISGLPLVPTVAAGLARLRSMEGYEFPHLRYITSTGQALPPAHIERLLAIFPDARLFSMYGLTECKRVSYLPPEELARRPGSVGKAMPRTEAWIVDEHGARVERAGVVGELVVRGPHVMQGYWNRPEETASALRNGLLHTGDLFRADEDGFLYFVARRDDLIKTAGQRVSPREIENVACTLDGVLEAVAFGIPDELLGQKIALVVRAAEGALTERDVIAHCEAHLEKYMVPRLVEIRRELPRTATGKVARREIAIGG